MSRGDDKNVEYFTKYNWSYVVDDNFNNNTKGGEVMINTNLLKAEIVKNGLTQSEFCKKIGMAHSTFIRKMRLGILNTDEAEKMIEVLDIKNPEKIFFSDKFNLIS